MLAHFIISVIAYGKPSDEILSPAPILIGLGYLVVYYMERKQERADRAKEVHSDNSDKIVSGEDEK